MTKLTLTLFILFLFSSCQSFYKLMQKGELKSDKNTTVVQYEKIFDLMIVPVEINGKQYKFLLDTGAPNVISLELAQELNLKRLSKMTVDDSQNNKGVHYLYNLDEIILNDFSFLNTTCIAIDINNPNIKISCLGIDGIIGSNLMKEAIWAFNFDKKEITISKNIQQIDVSNYDSLNFVYNNQFLPKLPITVNGVKSYISIDTGSNGRFRLNNKYFNGIFEKDSLQYLTSNYGSFSSGIYGKGKNVIRKFYLADSVLLDNYLISDIILDFQEKSSHLLGMEFFTQYNMVLDWFHKKVYLQQKENANFKSEKSFPLTIDRYHDQKTYYIRNIYEGFSDDKLSVGDTIISMNHTLTTTIEEDYCTFLFNLETLDSLHFEVLRNNDTLSYNIKRKEIFN